MYWSFTLFLYDGHVRNDMRGCLQQTWTWVGSTHGLGNPWFGLGYIFIFCFENDGYKFYNCMNLSQTYANGAKIVNEAFGSSVNIRRWTYVRYCRNSFLRATAYMLSAHMLSQFRPSVRLSVTRVDQSKTVEVRIMQFSPHSSPIPLAFAC